MTLLRFPPKYIVLAVSSLGWWCERLGLDCGDLSRASGPHLAEKADFVASYDLKPLGAGFGSALPQGWLVKCVIEPKDWAEMVEMSSTCPCRGMNF